MASTSAPPRAVVLKGPSTNSKSYFIALPGTLDELIDKAKSLFPLPPDKTPLITLGNDERAILMQETMPFVRDREPLVFRWIAATPKRQLGNRVRWDEPSSVQFNANAPSSSIGTPARPLLAQLGRTQSLELYSAKAPTSTRSPLPTPSKAAPNAARDPSVHFGDGLTARQAHTKRVLNEQREKEARRQRRIEGAQGHVAEAGVAVDVEVEVDDATHIAVDEVPMEEAQAAEPTMVLLDTVAEQEELVSVPVEAETVAPPPAPEAPLVSPPRKRHPDNVPLDTPPSSGSRSSSPYRSQDRKRAVTELQQTQQRDSEEQTSSPIQSPTRDLSAARQKAALAISDITLSPEVLSTYRYIDNLVLQLLSHGSNTAFAGPTAKHVVENSTAAMRHVDLFSIRQAIESKAYGSSHLSDSIRASKAIMLDFETDLSTMYANARKLHGSKSPQAQCADTLERFSTSFINEWKRSIVEKKPVGRGEGASEKKGDHDELKMAVLRQLTPTKRGEKRSIQLGVFPFVFNNASKVLFPGANGTAGTPLRKGEASSAAISSSSRPNSAAKKLSALEQPAQIKQMCKSSSVSDWSRFSSTSTSSKEAESLLAFERALRGPRPAAAQVQGAPTFTSLGNAAEPMNDTGTSLIDIDREEVQEQATVAKPVAERQPTPPPSTGQESQAAAAAERTTPEVRQPQIVASEEPRNVDAEIAADKPTEMTVVEMEEVSPASLAPALPAGAAEVVVEQGASNDAPSIAPKTTQEKVDRVVEDVICRSERESNQDSVHSSSAGSAGSGANTPVSSTGAKRARRGRPTRAETAAKLAAAALAMGAPQMPQTPTSERQARPVNRLSSSSPAKSATVTPSKCARSTASAPAPSADTVETTEIETRKSKRQRTSSSTSSSIATPPLPLSKGRKGGRKSISCTPTPTSASAKKGSSTTPFDLDPDFDLSDGSDDDDKPLRVRKTKKGEAHEVQQEEEKEVRLMFAELSSSSSTPASTPTTTKAGGAKKGAQQGRSKGNSKKRKAAATEEVEEVAVQPETPTRQTRSTRSASSSGR